MHYDVINLRTFYAGRLGRRVFDALSARLSAFWPSSKSDQTHRITGIGYAVPYLEKLWPAAELTALMPAHLGVHRWSGMQSPGGNKAALIDEPGLPVADNALDRVLLVHCLEHSSDAAALLAEVRRVLTPGGRLVIVVPNRLGWWSRSEQTAWGSGLPFSHAQIRNLLQEAELVPMRWTACLFLPPFLWQAMAAFSPYLLELTERIGRSVFSRFCGVIIVEADKLVHAPVKGRKSRHRGRVYGGRPAFAPNVSSAVSSASRFGETALEPIKSGQDRRRSQPFFESK